MYLTLKAIFAFRAIHCFAFLYRALDFTHNLKKNHFVAQSHTEDFPLGGSSLFILRFFGNNMKIGGMNHEEKNRCAGNFILCDRGAYICGLCLKEPHGNKEL